MGAAIIALVLALGLMGAGAAGATPHGGGTSTYPDPIGDVNGAPDISGITVSDDGAGTLTFQVAIANRPVQTPGMRVYVSINADKNFGTGAPNSGGAEFELEGTQAGGELHAWQGGPTWATISPSSLGYSYASGATFRVKESDLGGVTSFRFGVATLEIDMSTNPPTATGDFAGGSQEFVFPKATPKPKKPKPKKKH